MSRKHQSPDTFCRMSSFDTAADVMECAARRRDIIYEDDSLIVIDWLTIGTESTAEIISPLSSGELGLLWRMTYPTGQRAKIQTILSRQCASQERRLIVSFDHPSAPSMVGYVADEDATHTIIARMADEMEP